MFIVITYDVSLKVKLSEESIPKPIKMSIELDELTGNWEVSQMDARHNCVYVFNLY